MENEKFETLYCEACKVNRKVAVKDLEIDSPDEDSTCYAHTECPVCGGELVEIIPDCEQVEN